MNDFDCIVIGAGASGLTAASRLAAAGRRVCVLEAGGRVGGCIQSWRPEPGFWLELGAHTAYNSYAPLLRALDGRGRLKDLLLRKNLSYRFYRSSGKLQSPLARLSFLEAVFSAPFGALRSKAGRTVSEWFGGLAGQGNYRRLLAPAFAAVLSQNADGFPAEWLFRRKPRMEAAPRKYTFPGGLQGLLEALVEGAPFRLETNAAARLIERTPGGFRVILASGGYTCTQLVLAVPVDVAAWLLSSVFPEVAARLGKFPVASSEALGVVLPVGKSRLPALAGLMAEGGEFWSVVTRDPVPHEKLAGYTFHFRPGILDRDGKLALVARVLGVQAGDFLHVAETENRLPAPGPAHVLQAGEIQRLLKKEPLALVGNYLNGLSIGDCAELAEREADRLLAQPVPRAT